MYPDGRIPREEERPEVLQGASHLIADGCSIKAVSRRLGHADVTVTLAVYSHLMPDDDEKLARQAEALFA
jgi:integrase